MSKIFPEGVRFMSPHAGAPDFVKGKVIITLPEFFAWCKANPDFKTEFNGKEQIKLDLLKSQDGSKLYFALDNYEGKKADDLPMNNEQEQEAPW